MRKMIALLFTLQLVAGAASGVEFETVAVAMRDGTRLATDGHARQRLARGVPLRTTDLDALSAFAGEGLLRATLERIGERAGSSDRAPEL